MARKKPAAPERLRAMVFIVLFGASLLVFLSLALYFWQRGTSLHDQNGGNELAGIAGFRLADILANALGVFSVAFPVLLFMSGLAGARRWPLLASATRTLFVGGIALIAASASHLVPFLSEERRYFLGGAIGGYITTRLTELFGSWGAGVVLGTVALLIIVGTLGSRGISFLRGGLGLLRGAGIVTAVVGGAAVQGVRGAAGAVGRGLASAIPGGRGEEEGEEDDEEPEAEARRPVVTREDEEQTVTHRPGSNGGGETSEEEAGPPRIVSIAEALGENRRARRAEGASIRRAGGYTLPSLDLLEPPSSHRLVPKDELLARSELLEGRLKEFGAESRVVEVHPGPIITRFELQPARGVKVSQIANLADDLALGLRAQSIRIIAPIPGKGTVGVEIPNDHPSVVNLVEVLGNDVFRRSGSPLTLALGKDTSGQPRVAALEKMPHLLIAGSTGSGKSVCINAILLSLLATSSPEDVRMILIDPKRLELSLYNGIPHLLNPVVTEARAASRVLRWAVGQMESRYRILAAAGVRDIASYNRRAEGGGKNKGGGDLFVAPERLPYMVIVVDELADLMLTVPGEIEDALARLAQMARAVGIHIVLATQRPSVDVITGVIKANFPSRIAFKVPSKTDSRTILDANGAEALLGRGDMLFLEGGRPEAERIHGCMVTAADVERFCEHWRAQGDGVGEEVSFAEGETNGENATDDELFREAARLVITHQQGSASLLQRRLKVGYSRASRLIDMLEAAGVVGPFEGSKAREVLVDETYLDKMR